MKIKCFFKDFISKNQPTLFAVSHDLEEICLFADEVLFFDVEADSKLHILKKDLITIESLNKLMQTTYRDI